MVKFSSLLLAGAAGKALAEPLGASSANATLLSELCDGDTSACACTWEGESLNTTKPTLKTVEATRSKSGGCTSGSSKYTWKGWKTYVCSTEVCVTADPGFWIDAEKTTVESLHCRGRRNCCHKPYTVDELREVGLPVPVKVPVKACVKVEAEGKKEVGVRGRGECRISITQVHP